MLLRVRTALPWAYLAGLLWLNAYLVRHVFALTFTGATHSMHGYWMALGRVVGDGWWRPDWVPYWAGGMPVELTYAPLVPWLGWHLGLYAVMAGVFCLGPAALYLMAWQLSGKPGWAFVAGAAYSLLSPSEWVQADGAFAWVRFLEPQRMYLTLIWDEAPHQLALAFVCLAVAAWARGWRGWATVAVVLAALANPFGVTGAVIFALCWVLVSGGWRMALFSGLFGYLIVCPFYPPSLLGILRANAALAPESAWGPRSWEGLLAIGGGMAALWFVTRRWERTRRFAVLLAWVMTALPVLFYRWGIVVLQQPGRYKSEMELALVLLAVFALERVLAGRPRWVFASLAVLALVGAEMQVVRHRKFARNGIRQAVAEETIEYRAAQAVKGTVFTAGSLAHWMNAFADVRQYGGGSYATTPNVAQQRLVLELTVERSWERFVERMQAVGVDSVLIPGKASPEFWKPFGQDVLAGHLPVIWEERDTRLYAIPPATRSGGAVVFHRNWHPGWKAYRNGFAVPTRADELGQLVVEAPSAEGVFLVYEGEWWTRGVSLLAMAGLLVTVRLRKL